MIFIEVVCYIVSNTAPKISRLGNEEDYPVIGHQEDVYEYYRGLLSDEEKTVYDEFYEAALQFEPKFKLEYKGIDRDDLQKIYDFCWLDHPEIFWLEGYYPSLHLNGTLNVNGAVHLLYRYTADEAEEKQKIIQEYSEPIITQALTYLTDREKMDYVRTTLMENTKVTRVDLDEANDYFSMVSIFENNTSMCAGYAFGFKYIMDKVQVDTICVYNEVRNKDNGHMWNMIYIDGTWYNMDISYDDAEGQATNTDLKNWYMIENNDEFYIDDAHIITQYLPNL